MGTNDWEENSCRSICLAASGSDDKFSLRDSDRLGCADGAIFAFVAILQLLRALAGWPVTIGRTPIPVWVSCVAFVIAGVLAWIGITARLV